MNKNVVVLPVYNNKTQLITRLTYLADQCKDRSFLVIDDGSDDSLETSIETSERIHYLRHEKPLGYGGVVISAMEYAVSHECDLLYFIDVTNDGFSHVLFSLIESMEKYDLVSCSRFERDDVTSEYASMQPGRIVSHHLREATHLAFTDLFTPFMGMRVEAFDSFVLEEFDEAIFIQLWIQAVYYGLRMAELFCQECIRPDAIREPLTRDDEHYIRFIQGELLLYPLEEKHEKA